MLHFLLRGGAPIAALLLVLPGSLAPAQSLADAIPATCVLYIRDEDPIGRFEKMSGSGEVWSDPKQTSARTRRSMDKAFKQGDKALGRDEGTLDGWLRSVGSVELALFSLNLDFSGGEMVQLDYAASFESPAAIEMFNTFGKMMIDEGQATKNEKGDFVIGFGPDMSAVLSIHGNRIVLASSEDRLSSITSALKSGMPSPLSSDPTFRACTGEGASPSIMFVRVPTLLQVIRDNIDSQRIQQRMTEVVNSFGLSKIAGIGYHEEGGNGIVIAKGSEPVPVFKLLKGKQGPPGVLEKMPADCVFAIGRTDEIGPHLARIQKHLLDPLTFPFASDVGKGLDEFKAATGLNLDQVLASLKGGVVFAGVPDDNGKFHEEKSMVVVAKAAAREEALAILGMIKQGAAGSGMELEQTEENNQVWLKPKKSDSRPAGAKAADPAPAPAPVPAGEPPEGEGGVVVVFGESRPGEGTDTRARVAARRERRLQAERERPKPVVVWSGEVIIAGLEDAVRRTLLAQTGQIPTLGSSGAFKRLAPQATWYMTTSLRAMFAGENDFATALPFLKDFGNTGTSIVVEDDLLIAISNRSASEQISTILTAAAMDEDGSEQRREVLDQLTEIATRTKAFQEKNKKWPASLTDLGYTAKDMPAAKDLAGKAHAIVFLPPKGDANPEDYRTLLAYYPSADYGRLAVAVAGNAWRWSESDFLTALAKYNSPK